MERVNDWVLEGRGLVKDFVQGGTTLRVLAGADIAVRRGERIAIVGASGSGKTTLLQLLGGLDLPSAGTVRIAGESVTELDEVERLGEEVGGAGLEAAQASANAIPQIRSTSRGSTRAGSSLM